MAGWVARIVARVKGDAVRVDELREGHRRIVVLLRPVHRLFVRGRRISRSACHAPARRSRSSQPPSAWCRDKDRRVGPTARSPAARRRRSPERRATDTCRREIGLAERVIHVLPRMDAALAAVICASTVSTDALAAGTLKAQAAVAASATLAYSYPARFYIDFCGVNAPLPIRVPCCPFSGSQRRGRAASGGRSNRDRDPAAIPFQRRTGGVPHFVVN